MEWISFGLILFAALSVIALLVWAPRQSIDLFGLSPYALKRVPSEDLVRILTDSLQRQGLRVERNYFDLPPTSLLAISQDGSRTLISTSAWNTPTFSAQFWLDLEQQRLRTHAQTGWVLRPGIDGSWSAWLKQTDLLQIKTCSFSQLFYWLRTHQMSRV